MLDRITASLVISSICLAVALRSSQASYCQAMTTPDALVLFQQHRWAEAAGAFESVEKAQPGKTDALLYRAKSLVNLSQFSEAAVSLEAYLARHPQSDDALYLLAYVRFREDKPQDSLKLYT